MNQMRAPINNVSSGLLLANSIIAGTPIADEILKWKMKHNAPTRHAVLTNSKPTDAAANLGWGYWRGFIKQNGHWIDSKRAVKIEAK